MSGRAAIGVAGSLAVVAAGGVAVTLLASGPQAGPLARDVGEPNTIVFDVEVGKPFSYGLVVLRNPTLAAGRITSVELSERSGEVELVEAGVRSMHDVPEHGLVANDRVYPPVALSGFVSPAIGAPLPPYHEPADAVELVLGLRVHGAGSHGFRGVVVGYELDHVAYRARFPFALTVCAPPSGRPCDPSG